MNRQPSWGVPILRTLLLLGRISNLPTVWSNCLAGWILGGGGTALRLALLCLGASCLYIAGMFLNDAFDAEFDRQFLTLMIQHHNGALKMVSDLFATPHAAQDVDVSVFANDVQSVQTAEIGTMQQMLGNL